MLPPCLQELAKRGLELGEVAVRGSLKGIYKGSRKGIYKGSLEGIYKGSLKGIYKGSFSFRV